MLETKESNIGTSLMGSSTQYVVPPTESAAPKEVKKGPAGVLAKGRNDKVRSNVWAHAQDTHWIVATFSGNI